MKKIVFIIDNLKGGGAEKAIKIIVEGLEEKGFNPTIVLLENRRDYSLSNNADLYCLTNKITIYNSILIYFKLVKLLKSLSPNIIYATNTKSQIFTLITKPLYKKAKRVINIQVDLTKQYESRRYIFNIFNELLTYADAYSFISKGIYENLKGKIPAKENIFIPNPIDFEEIDKLKLIPIEKKYSHIFEKKVFITIGRLTEQKGQWNLLEAFSKINQDYNLIIVGAGEKEKELKELSKKYNIEDRVYFLGFQINPFQFLYNADVFVLSSLWEGFGNVIVEAMRCELPIISTDCPSGPREILSPNSNINFRLKNDVEISNYGILTPVNETIVLSKAMEDLMGNREDKERYSSLSMQRANDYSKNKVINKFERKLL